MQQVFSINIADFTYPENTPPHKQEILVFSFQPGEIVGSLPPVKCKIIYLSPKEVDESTFLCLFDTDSYNFRVVPTRNLDREKEDTYVLKFVGYDLYGKKVAQTKHALNIHISDYNDNQPVFNESSLTIEIAESTKMGTKIGKIRVTDQDLSVRSTKLRHLFHGKDCFELPVRSDVEIPCKTSYVKITKSGEVILNSKLDADTLKMLKIVVEVEDNSEIKLTNYHKVSAVLKIKLLDRNDNAPFFKNSSMLIKLSENHDVSLPVLKFSVKDNDVSQVYRKSWFKILGRNKNSFVTRGNYLYLTEKLDYEGANFIGHRAEVTVVAQNLVERPLSSKLDVIIDIIDENEAPLKLYPTSRITFWKDDVLSTIFCDLDFAQNQTLRAEIINDPEESLSLLNTEVVVLDQKICYKFSVQKLKKPLPYVAGVYSAGLKVSDNHPISPKAIYEMVDILQDDNKSLLTIPRYLTRVCKSNQRNMIPELSDIKALDGSEITFINQRNEISKVISADESHSKRVSFIGNTSSLVSGKLYSFKFKISHPSRSDVFYDQFVSFCQCDPMSGTCIKENKLGVTEIVILCLLIGLCVVLFVVLKLTKMRNTDTEMISNLLLKKIGNHKDQRSTVFYQMHHKRNRSGNEKPESRKTSAESVEIRSTPLGGIYALPASSKKVENRRFGKLIL